VATFQVPQFIEQKPKIIGPLTLRQFAFIASASFLSFLSYYVFDFFLWAVTSVILELAGILLAFGKINGQDSVSILKSFFFFLINTRVYVWSRGSPDNGAGGNDSGGMRHIRSLAGIQEKLQAITLGVTTGKLFSTKRSVKSGGQNTQLATMQTGEKVFLKRMDYKE